MLTYRRSDFLHVEGYSDLDFAGDADNRKSTSGYVFTLAGGAIMEKLQANCHCIVHDGC
jgi:hypothetical protein